MFENLDKSTKKYIKYGLLAVAVLAVILFAWWMCRKPTNPQPPKPQNLQPVNPQPQPLGPPDETFIPQDAQDDMFPPSMPPVTPPPSMMDQQYGSTPSAQQFSAYAKVGIPGTDPLGVGQGQANEMPQYDYN